MRKKIVGILVCTLLIATTIFPIAKTTHATNDKNNTDYENPDTDDMIPKFALFPKIPRLFNRDWDYWSNKPNIFLKRTGNVGIGTKTPSEKLEVLGNISISGQGNGLHFPDGSYQTTAADCMSMKLTLIPVDTYCISGVGESFTKISDIGSFTKSSASTVIELSYCGTIGIQPDPGATGAIFELRIDDAGPMEGRSLIHMWYSDDTVFDDEWVSINSIFSGLTNDIHVVSMWVKGTWGGLTQACYSPGVFDTAQIIVKEYDASL